MRSLTHLDYLSLEFNQTDIMKYLVSDKSTQCDVEKYNEILTEHNNVLSISTTISKQPPKRPPPPKLTVSCDDNFIEKSETKKSGNINNIMSIKDMRIKNKFNTLKENTKRFTRTVKRRMSKPYRPKSEFQVLSNGTCTVASQTLNDGKSTTNSLQDTEKVIRPLSAITLRSKPSYHMDRSKSLNNKSEPPKITKCISSVISLEDIVDEQESIFSKFFIMSLITNFLKDELFTNEISDLDQYIDGCLKAFVKTSYRQVKDTIMDVNDRFSHSLDLDSISLFCNQPELYTVKCIPGWKQIRIIDDNNSKERFLALKLSHYQSWILLNQEKIDSGHRWICFPVLSINTLENEILLSENCSFQNSLLKMIMLLCVSSVYKDEKFPKNIDPNTILLVSSKCGIIIVFKECLNESEVLSLEFLECDSVDDIEEVLVKSKSLAYQLIADFFQRPEVISVLISSIWPLDYLALLLAELVIDNE